MTLDARILMPLVKNRVDVPHLLERVFGETEQRGSMAFCPFHKHNRNTPSLHIQDEGARWRCYSCGLYGDVIDFWQRGYLQRTGKRLSFEGAVTSLAAVAGIPLDGVTTPQTMLLIAQALRDNPGAKKTDAVRARLFQAAGEILDPLIRSVRQSGTSGAWSEAEFLGERLDALLRSHGRPYTAVWRDVLDLEAVARGFLRTAESLAEWPEENFADSA